MSTFPTSGWAIIGLLITGYGVLIGGLLRELASTRKELAKLQAKVMDQAIPALERSTLAGQALVPVLERVATAMGGMQAVGEENMKAIAEVRQTLAINAAINPRPPRRGGA